MTCYVFVDESGDTGVSKIRTPEEGGSSPYFCLGAVLMRDASKVLVRKLLDELQKEFGKTKRWKHATDLNHSQKVYFARRLAALKLRFYGVISNKYTLSGYADEIRHEPHKFYNKCIKYLLEVVTSDLAMFPGEFHNLEVILEDRNHDYDALRRYLIKVKGSPFYPQSKPLEMLNPFAITSRTKAEEDLLRVADFVSHSIYSCVNKTPDNFYIPEPRYWRELSVRFATDQRGRILGSGLKCIHSIEDLELDTETKSVLENARANPTRRAR